MHDNTAIGGWDDVRKPWNLGFSYKTKMIVFSTLFLVEIRYKLLKRLAMEHDPQPFAGALAPATVTLVILWERDPKFSL
jgi:hypothetical protein